MTNLVDVRMQYKSDTKDDAIPLRTGLYDSPQYIVWLEEQVCRSWTAIDVLSKEEPKETPKMEEAKEIPKHVDYGEIKQMMPQTTPCRVKDMDKDTVYSVYGWALVYKKGEDGGLLTSIEPLIKPGKYNLIPAGAILTNFKIIEL